MVDSGSMSVPLPEKLGRKMTFASYSVEDLMRGGAFLMLFVIIGFLSGIIGFAIIMSLIGLIMFWVFGLMKIDGMTVHQYLGLKIHHAKMQPLKVSTMKVFEGGVIYTGKWFKIIEVTSSLSLDFMSDGAKMVVFERFHQMLNKCAFPMQIIVHSWKVNPEVFDKYIKSDSELAEGYRRLLRDNTKDLYLQSVYVIPIAQSRDVKGSSMDVRYRRAREVLDIYADDILKSLATMGLSGRVVEKHTEIFSIVEEAMGGVM